MAEHPQRQRRRKDHDKGDEIDPGRRQQHPQRPGRHNNVDHGAGDLDEDQPRTRQFDRYRAEPETLPPECAGDQRGSRDREDQNGDEAERFVRYPIELGDLVGPKRQPEADRLGGTDTEGGSYIERDARDLGRGYPDSAVNAVTHGTAREGPETHKIAQRVSAERGQQRRGDRRSGTGVAQCPEIIGKEYDEVDRRRRKRRNDDPAGHRGQAVNQSAIADIMQDMVQRGDGQPANRYRRRDCQKAAQTNRCRVPQQGHAATLLAVVSEWRRPKTQARARRARYLSRRRANRGWGSKRAGSRRANGGSGRVENRRGVWRCWRSGESRQVSNPQANIAGLIRSNLQIDQNLHEATIYAL